MKKEFDWNRFWEQVDEYMGVYRSEVTEEGGFTIDEFATRYNLTPSTARYWLRKMMKEGKVRVRGKRKIGRYWVTIYELA